MYAERFISARKARDEARRKSEGSTYEVTYLTSEEAKGNVKKKTMWKTEATEKNQLIELTIYELEPGAELLPRKHVYDAGYYRVEFSNFICCENGESFSYKNTTDHLVKVTLIRYSVIV